jgi:hypothetical protein
MKIRRFLIAAALSALAGACQHNPNDDIVYTKSDSAPPSPPPTADDTEPVDESPVDESYDDDIDDVLAGEGDSP